MVIPPEASMVLKTTCRKVDDIGKNTRNYYISHRRHQATTKHKYLTFHGFLQIQQIIVNPDILWKDVNLNRN
jgi:hypothetical protein